MTETGRSGERERWVPQEDADGCGIAVLAMLTGQTYAEVNFDFPHRLDGLRDPDVKPHEMYGYLWDRGWFLRVVRNREVTGGVWPPPPFAPMHYAMVNSPTARGGHWIAVSGEGGILDPFDARRTSWEPYAVVHEVVGVTEGFR